MKRMNSKNIIFVLLAVVFGVTACKKDYYKDTGRHTPNYDGTVMDFLEAKPQMFDSIVKIIQYTQMESVFENEEITFFAPADSSVRYMFQFVNFITESIGLPKLTRIEQISPQVWRKYLNRYIFKGKKSMNDYRQIDPTNLAAYSGQIYESYDGALMNVGVIYNDAGGVKYAGYRQLMISYIPFASSPLDYTTWWSAIIASVNIAPRNGYVHALQYVNHYFGFSPMNFTEDVIAAGIKP